jgi:hypothetical protein
VTPSSPPPIPQGQRTRSPFPISSVPHQTKVEHLHPTHLAIPFHKHETQQHQKKRQHHRFHHVFRSVSLTASFSRLGSRGRVAKWRVTPCPADDTVRVQRGRKRSRVRHFACRSSSSSTIVDEWLVIPMKWVEGWSTHGKVAAEDRGPSVGVLKERGGWELAIFSTVVYHGIHTLCCF